MFTVSSCVYNLTCSLIYGWCRNDEEENIFKGIPVGGFLLRFSASNPGHISVWIKTNGPKNSHKLLTPSFLEKNLLIQTIMEDKKHWGFGSVVMNGGIALDKREFISLCSVSSVQEKTEDKNNSNSRYEEVVDY